MSRAPRGFCLALALLVPCSSLALAFQDRPVFRASTELINVDVVVTDGFSGNIALKSIEGTARFITDLLKRAFSSSLRSQAGFILSRPAFKLLRHHLDPNNHNGAVFLGLNGVVVKSHGSANAKGVANAVEVAARLLEDDITNRIKHDLAAVGTEGLAAK